MESISFDKLLENIINEFRKMCEIPHPSDKLLDHAPGTLGRCWNISCHFKQEIERDCHLDVSQDKYGNLWFDVPANDPKYRNYPIVALQGHIDMVFSYDETQFPLIPVPHKTKIELVDEIKDGKRVLHSLNYKTSIGADNGLPVSCVIALLKEPNFKHGPLRVILTNCEENASQGASLLVRITNPNILKGVKYLINLDGETLGEMVVGCSGASGNFYEQCYKPLPIPADKNRFKVTVSGFKGGHSGQVVYKQVSSSLKFMSVLLKKLSNDKSLQLISMDTPGTVVYNRVPIETVVSFATYKTKEEIEKAFASTLRKFKKMPKVEGDLRTYDLAFSNEHWDDVENGFSVEKETKATKCISVEDSKAIIALQNELPCGLIAWPTDKDAARFVGEQTSSNVAPATLILSKDETYFTYSTASYFRSSVTPNIDKYFDEMGKICHKRLGKVVKMGPKASQSVDTYTFDAKFPAWPNNGLKLSKLAEQGWLSAGVPKDKIVYTRIHAGIECSWWCQAAEQVGGKLYQTSLGPDIKPCHEITETCEVDTIIPFVKTVIYILQNVNKLEK